jgi:hypothetical protein
MRELYMAADIPPESLVVLKTGSKTSWMVALFQDKVVALPFIVEAIRRAQTCYSTPYY